MARKIRSHLKTRLVALICALALQSGAAWAQAKDEEIDTDHLFAFAQGTDVGAVGTREVESGTSGRFGKRRGKYAAYVQELELGYVPVENLHLFAGASAAYFDIAGVPAFDDRDRLSFNELEIEARYKVLDRARTSFGLAVQIQPRWATVEELSGEAAKSYGMDVELLADKELVQGRLVSAVNIAYALETTRTGALREKASALRINAALMGRVRAGFFMGAELRHERRYEGLGLGRLAGEATFVGPTLCWKPGDLWVIAAWSRQVAGRARGESGGLDLANFERNLARLTIGFSF